VPIPAATAVVVSGRRVPKGGSWGKLGSCVVRTMLMSFGCVG
jgi:hypothetical protein